MTNGYIRVHVLADSGENSLKKMPDGTFAVSVRAEAKRGMANKSVMSLLQSYFGKGVRLRLISGHHSGTKIFSVN